jgi:flagellar basal body-associated protein FliL
LTGQPQGHERGMLTILLIVVILILLFGGGGYAYRGRRRL